jgi:hypothetical protein
MKLALTVLLQFELSDWEIKHIVLDKDVKKCLKTIEQIIRERKVWRVQSVYLLVAVATHLQMRLG